MSSERIYDAGLSLICWPIDALLASRLPRLLRFALIPLAMLLGFVGVLLSIPFLIAGTVVEMWERTGPPA